MMAQSSGAGPVLVWSGVLVIAVVAGAIVVLWARRSLLSDREPGGAGGLSLHELRQLRARGELTEAEFEAAKAVVIGSSGRAAGPPDRPQRGGTPGERRAAPGFDLTGEPLPPSASDEPGR